MFSDPPHKQPVIKSRKQTHDLKVNHWAACRRQVVTVGPPPGSLPNASSSGSPLLSFGARWCRPVLMSWPVQPNWRFNNYPSLKLVRTSARLISRCITHPRSQAYQWCGATHLERMVELDGLPEPLDATQHRIVKQSLPRKVRHPQRFLGWWCSAAIVRPLIGDEELLSSSLGAAFFIIGCSGVAMKSRDTCLLDHQLTSEAHRWPSTAHCVEMSRNPLAGELLRWDNLSWAQMAMDTRNSSANIQPTHTHLAIWFVIKFHLHTTTHTAI